MPAQTRCVTVTALIALAGAAEADRFSIVVLPDTQNYVTSAANAPLFTQQTQWIADQILLAGNPDDIVFVTHVGDVVSSGSSTTQYNRAETALGVLDGGLPESVVPWSVLPGNHDYASTGNKGTGTDLYLSSFGAARFAGKSWFGGSDASGNNTYQHFEGGGQTFLHIALEWRPTINVTNGPTRDPSPVEWAQSVINDNPGLPVILSTHEHLDDSPAGRSPAGVALWEELIRSNDQIIMVLGGHNHGAGGTNDGEYHQIGVNNFGKPVFEILQDYQDYPNGGDGWLRILTFDTDLDQIDVFTYSPVLDQFQTETVAQVGQFASRFTLPIDFDARFNFADPPEPPTEVFEQVVFQQGLDGYNGTLDKEVRSSGGDASNGDAPSISVDGDDGSPGLQPNHGLLRFESIVGMGPNQLVPAGDFRDAQLVLNVTNPGSGFTLHTIAQTWDESTTWAALGGDGVTPGVEAATQPIATLGANTSSANVGSGTLGIDVSEAVRAWVNGTTNHGLGFVTFTNGTNGIDFDSSEGPVPPALVVRRLIEGFEAADFRQGTNGYTDAADTVISQSAPGTGFGSDATVTIDADEPNGSAGQNQFLIRFGDIFEGARGVPAEDTIVRAFLTINGTDPGDGATLHRVLVSWDDGATWASAFGGDGVQPDEVEAVLVPDAVVSGSTGKVEIDVTASLQAWQADPSTNFGWVFLPIGGNGWDITTSDAGEMLRPTLTVVTESFVCLADTNRDDDLTPADFNAWVIAFNNQSSACDQNGDGLCNPADFNAWVINFNMGCP